MKDGTLNAAMLNYNAITEEIVFQQNGQVLALADPALSQTDTVFISDRKLVPFEDEFAELILNGEVKLLALLRCSVIPPGNPAPFGGTSQISSVDKISRWGANNTFYDLNLPEDFKIETSYMYRIDNGSGWKKVNSMKQLRKFYKKSRDRFDQYVSEQEIQFDDPTQIAALVQWMEAE
ncbi:hypothetical protein JS578_01570 [Dysgonomonadaceae bacterium zrk40]|nr:hypothetical protein JS578_01570 [Dysgonomonadaceae bacterium zrk40]